MECEGGEPCGDGSDCWHVRLMHEMNGRVMVLFLLIAYRFL